MYRKFYIIISIFIFIGISIGVFFASEYYARKWESQRLKKIVLQDTFGRPWKLSKLKEKIGIVYFGYTSCPDACPTALNTLVISLKEMGEEKSMYQPIFISVDPVRDTPKVIRKYLDYFDKNIIGLFGTSAQLKVFSFNLGATYSYQKDSVDDKDYLVNHTVGFFMVTSNGARLPIPVKENSDELLQAIRKVTGIILK